MKTATKLFLVCANFILIATSVAAQNDSLAVSRAELNAVANFNGLKVHCSEIELLGYAIGFRNGYAAVKVAVSGEQTSPATINRICDMSLQEDRRKILRPFNQTKPGADFFERLEAGLVDGHSDGENAGRKAFALTRRGKEMPKLREGLLEKAVYEKAKTKDGLGSKDVHRITGFLRNRT